MSNGEKEGTQRQYTVAPNELFCRSESVSADYSEQREMAKRLMECFERLNISARLLSVGVSYAVSSYVFEALTDSAFRKIKESIRAIEYECLTKGNIRVYESFRTYKRDIALGESIFVDGSSAVEKTDCTQSLMQLSVLARLVTLEVPLAERRVLLFGDTLDDERSCDPKASPLSFCVGMDTSQRLVFSDMTRLQSLLVSGATGSGKSYFLHSMIASFIKNNSPSKVKLLLIDPKQVEFSDYVGLPHSLTEFPIFDEQKAIEALGYVVEQISERFRLMTDARCRDIASYNERACSQGAEGLSYLVVMIDEIVPLILHNKKEFERLVGIICQKGKAAGIHLVLSTQRPSVDVLSGVIRANIYSTAAFYVPTAFDSKVVMGQIGAENLLGRGDMLFMAPDYTEAKRILGCAVTIDDVKRLTEYMQGFATHSNKDLSL